MQNITDTLTYDTAKIAAYQADKRFDYNSQLDMPEINLAEIIFKWLSGFFSRFVDVEVAESVTWWFLVVFFLVVLFLIAFFIYKKRPELFIREKKQPIPYEIQEENIYGVDFEDELDKALKIKDYRAAVRIVYLQTMRFLADNQHIDWQIYKSPTEYIYEIKSMELRTTFRQFTSHFLRVRYGNFKATGELFEMMQGLSQKIMEGGSDEE